MLMSRPFGDLIANSVHLKTAITVLSELMARKATLDTHMNTVTASLEDIKKQGLDELFSAEEEISKQTVQPSDNQRRNDIYPKDKLRLVLVFYLSVPDTVITKEDTTELENELKAGADVALDWRYRHSYCG